MSILSSGTKGPGSGRVIALVDMDCFYVQVEERDDPSIRGVPAAVVQYKAWKGGGIIAVNYEARARGVTRSMRGDDAKAACPEIVLVRVPETNEKANLTKYRDAGKEVIDVICQFSSCVERASIDEAYIDLTEAVTEFLAKISPNVEENLEECLDAIDRKFLEGSFPVGFDTSDGWLEALKASDFISMDDVRLAVGAEIVGRMRKAVLDKTGFKCSAGIAHNKVLAKLGAGMNKPNKQTVIPHTAVPILYEKTPVRKVRMLGGQFGEALTEIFGCEKMSDLAQHELKKLTGCFGEERGQWLYNLARGFDDEPVVQRQLPKSIGCSKNFPGPDSLNTKEKTSNWIRRLSEEVVERIERDYEMNNRRAKLLTLHVKFQGKKGFSRSCGKYVPYNPEKMAGVVWTVMEKLYQQYGILPIHNLGLIASKLEEDAKGIKISTFYAPAPDPAISVKSPRATSPDLFEDTQDEEHPMSPCLTTKSKLANEVESISHSQMLSSKLEVGNVAGATTDVKMSPKKLVESTNIHIVPATYNNGSDDEVDIEGFTPDSPRVNVDAPLTTAQSVRPSCKIELETVPEPIPSTSSVSKVTSVSDEGISSAEASSDSEPNPVSLKPNTAKDHELRNPSPLKKPAFVCSKSPPKIRKAIITKDNPLPLMFPSLNKYVQKDPKPVPVHKATETKVVQVTASVNTIFEPTDSEPDYMVAGVDTRTLSKEYLQTCDICKKSIPLWEFLNHKDYHVALELQKKFNGGPSFPSETPVRNNQSAPANASSSSGHKRTASSSRGKASKRGRPTKSAPVNSSASPNKMRTLDSYFLPKN